MRTNIILIGMPGVGKSTVGVIAAKTLGMQFTDVDLLIQAQEHMLLEQLIAQKGIDGFLDIENRIGAAIDTERTIIATGGSMIYGKEAMANLRRQGMIIYLQLSYPLLERRLGDLKKRGVILRKGQDLYGLYLERTPLYEAWSDAVICCDHLGIEEVVGRVEEVCREKRYD